jgi:YidC/Oxa1 family membrane protein insertase
MEKRVLVAVVLSFLVLYLYQAFLAPPPTKLTPKPAPVAQGGAEGAVASAVTPPVQAATDSGSSAGATSVQAGPVATAVALVGEAEERDVEIQTDVLRVIFTNRGARVKHWELKGYHDTQGAHVDLVPQGVKDATLPFSLVTGHAAIDAQINNALFKVVDQSSTARGSGPRKLAFEYRDSAGIVAHKAFTLIPDGYTIGFAADLAVGGTSANLAVAMGAGLGDVETSSGTSYSQKASGVVHRGGKLERFNAKAIVAQPAYEGTYDFAGADDHYFISAALLGNKPAGITYRHRAVAKTPAKAEYDFVSYTLNPGGDNIDLTFYIGPKEFATLKAVDQNLVRAINFGMFGWLAVPLLSALKGLNAYLNNFGWSIIALTVLINLAIFPLRQKSFVSMRKLQALQPEIKAIQERYGKVKATDPDKQKMNAELMGLYKERGVNPASGCVPILLTMPLLFAFYSLLSAAIELRGAPFMLWITDLSVHDPYYVTPILMGGTMVLQQLMTPSQADPVQQKMMMIMPVVFTGMFLWAPSGLVVYWFVSNLLAITQQFVTNKMLPPVTAKDLKPVKK